VNMSNFHWPTIVVILVIVLAILGLYHLVVRRA
jgi:hypothetical protein